MNGPSASIIKEKKEKKNAPPYGGYKKIIETTLIPFGKKKKEKASPMST